MSEESIIADPRDRRVRVEVDLRLVRQLDSVREGGLRPDGERDVPLPAMRGIVDGEESGIGADRRRPL